MFAVNLLIVVAWLYEKLLAQIFKVFEAATMADNF